MQAAAPTALLTKEAKTAKPTGKHAAPRHAKVEFHAVLGAKAKAVAEAAEKNRSAILAALLSTLGKGAAAGKAHVGETGKGISLVKVAQAGNAPHQTPQAAKIHLTSVDGEEGGETGKQVGKPARKKPAHALHADGLGAEAASIVASLANGIGNLSGKTPDHIAAEARKAGPGDHAATIVHAVQRKAPEIRVHIVDARKKPDSQTQDTAAVLKLQKLAAPDREAQAPLIARDGAAADNAVRESRRQSPAPPAPVAGALERLREMAGAELTRAAGIILRDGGGEIKLLLKPESLGSVRIRMNLVDNAIEGRIIVDNSAVKHVFEGSLDSLMRALTAEGFQTASLQVSVGGQNAGNGRQDREPVPRIRQAGARGFERNVPGVENMSLGDLLVNLFV